jgi:hypothetical protein
MSTTTDPVRLIADPGRPESERALLQLGADIAPPRDAEARVWLALVGAIGVPGAAGAAAASPKTKTATQTTTTTTAAKTEAGLTAVKIAAVVVTLVTLTALLALGSYLVGAVKGPRPPEPIATAPAAGTPVPPAAGAPAPPPPAEDAPPPAEAAPARPTPGTRRAVRDQLRPRTAAGPWTTAPSAATRLREETTLIRDARQALRAGDAARALGLLDESRRLFPAGVLQQERERLAIEALLEDGRAAEASARAAAFLRKYPNSPHAAEIRALNLGAAGR